MTESNRIGFEALIKEVKTKSLATGDKSVRVLLEIDNPPKGLVAALDELQDPINRVGVAIAESKE